MRKLLSVFCVAVTLFAAITVFPKAAAAAPGAISLYEPKELDMGVLNQAMFQDTNAYNAFYSRYVTAHSAFNQIDRFGPVQLLYGGSYIRPNYYLRLDFAPLSTMDFLRKKDDLQMLIRGTMHSVMHYGPTHKRTEVTAFTGMRLTQGVNGDDILADRVSYDWVTAATALGDNVWLKLRNNPFDGTTFKLRVQTGSNLYGGGCTCGDARVSNIAIAFADAVSPKLVKAAVTSDAAGTTPDTTFGEGDTVYIHLYFDEPVRLSDHSALHDDAKLYLDVFDMGGQQVTGTDVVATLDSLKDRRVTFKYTVPAKITASGGTQIDTNHYIGGISKIQSGLLTGPGNSSKFPLALLDNNETAVSLPDALRGFTQLTHTTSLITDLAGNPVSSLGYALNEGERAKIDSVNPVVEKVDVSHDPSIPIFAGPGGRLVFSATFQEPLNIDLAKDPAALAGVTGTVNLEMRADGTAATVPAQSLSTDKKTLTFAPLTITADLKPVATQIGGQQVAYATITSIAFPSGVTDLCGNPYDGTVAQAARSQYYVDTLGPTVIPDPNLTKDGALYVPSAPTQAGSGFRFSFIIAEDASDGAAYSSGLAPRGQYAGPVGRFAWVNDYVGVAQNQFMWAVTTSPDTPDTGWTLGLTEVGPKQERHSFTEIEGGILQYLHVRLIDSEQYNIADSSLVFYPKDFSGNEGEAAFPIKYVADEAGPGYAKNGLKTGFNSATQKGRITALIKVADPSEVDPDSIRYQWMLTNDAAPNPGEPAGWTSYARPGDASAGFDLAIDTEDLAPGSHYSLYLYVSSKDLLGNESVSPAYRFDFDLSHPAFGVEVSEGVWADPTLILTPPHRRADGTPSTMIVMIKDPLGPTGDEYFVRTMNSEGWGTAGDVLSGLIWTTNPTDYNYDSSPALTAAINDWRYVRLIRDGDFTLHDGSIVQNVQYGFAHAKPGVNATGECLWDLYRMNVTSTADVATAQRLMAIVGGRYYGDIELTALTGYGATGRLVWEQEVGHTAEGIVYKVNAKNNGTFVNEAAYYWAPPYTEPYANKGGYYYDRDLTQPVDLWWAAYPDERDSAGCFVSYIPSGTVVAAQNWTLRAAAGGVVLVQRNDPVGPYTYAPTGWNSGYGEGMSPTYDLNGKNIHAVGVEPVRKELLSGISGWVDPDDGARYVNSIDGEEIVVSLGNRLMPAWGVADIDFSSDQTYLSLVLLNSPDSNAPPPGTEIYRTPLEQQVLQTVTLPAVTAYSGRYRITVQVKAKASSALSTGSYDQIWVDRTGISEFGLARVISTVVATIGGDTLNRTTVAWHGYDSLDRPAAEYEHPDIRLGSAVGGGVSSLTHTLHFTAKSAGAETAGVRYGDLFLKVWNASSDLSPEEVDAGRLSAKWVPVSTKCGTGIGTTIVSDKTSLSANYVSAGGSPLVPLLAGKENVLYYQTASSNGKSSDVRTLFATVSDELAELEVELNPSSSDKMLNHTMANVTKLTSQTLDSLAAYYWDGVQVVPVSKSVRLTNSGTHAFLATNAFGNYTLLEKTVDFVDGTAPAVADADGGQMYNDRFELKYIISDNYKPGGRLPKGFSFYLRFEDDYNKALGLEPGQFYEVLLPDYTSGNAAEFVRTATEPSEAGIYEVIASPVAGGSEILVTLKGVFKHDPAEGPTASHSVFVYARDIAGNESNVVSDSAQMNNILPAVTNVQKALYTNWDYGGFDFIDVNARFSVPVLLEEPAETAGSQFSNAKHYLPIFTDENGYKFGFRDIFGDSYTNLTDIACLGTDSILVTYSTTEPTSESVRVNIQAVADSLTFSAWQGAEQFASGTRSAYRDLLANDILYCMLWPGTANSRYVEIPVSNIFVEPPTAKVTWYYSEFGTNEPPYGVTETTGEVTAYLASTCNRSIYPTNGTAASHTFVVGDTTSSFYTFEFSDAAQNAGGPLTTQLPVNIVAPPPPPIDSDPPLYHLNIYAKHNGVHRLMGSWSNETGWSSAYGSFSATLDAISWTSGYLLDFDLIEDASPTRLLLLAPDAATDALPYDVSQSSGDVAGVALSGRSITISGNASFKVAMIDGLNNVTALSVTASSVDTGAPSITLDKVQTDFYKARVYARVTDDVSGAGPLLSPTSAPTLADAASPYDGWYYFDFTEDGSVHLVAEDNAHNRATATASVDGIDTTAPISSVLWWSPSTGQVQTQPPSGALSRDVSVGIGFDRNIESLAISVRASGADVPSANVGDYVRADLAGDKATLVFLKDTDSVTLQYTGQNGKTGSRQFSRGIHYSFNIDKDAPVVSVSDLAGLDVPTARSVTVTFTVGAESVTAETGETLSPGAVIARTISSRGIFTYRFFDEAGNVTEKTVEIKNIDVEPPIIMVMGEDNGGAYKNGSHTFYATLNEKGKVTFGGVSTDVAAPVDWDLDGKYALNYLETDPTKRECDWSPLTVTQNGTYQIVAEDVSGRKSSTYVTVSCLDNTPPSIAFSLPTTLSVRQGTTLGELQAMFQAPGGALGEGLRSVVVSDNVSLPVDIQLAVDLTGWDQARLNGMGIATVAYTATDGAGNARSVARNVRIYPANELVLTVNNQKTDAFGATVFTGETVFTLGIENLAAGDSEPVKIYLLAGRWTAGQMKSLSTEVSRTFTIGGKGYYTLYVVSQSRQAYLTYLYIQ